MRRVQNAVFIHLVWATWDRLPLLTGAIERDAHRAIEARCKTLGAEILAVGGVEDHIHLLIRLPATLAVADVMKHLKGASAHLLTPQLHPDTFFKWQGAYGAFSVSLNQISHVSEYIARQREHHASSTIIADWEPQLTPRNERSGEEKPA